MMAMMTTPLPTGSQGRLLSECEWRHGGWAYRLILHARVPTTKEFYTFICPCESLVP
jgi:hypothetical protein